VITGVAAIGLALTMPAFAQNTTTSPSGNYNYHGATAQTSPVEQSDPGGAGAPRGRVFYLIACGGGATGVSDVCYTRAQQLCHGAYIVLSEDQRSEPQGMRIACRR